MVPQREVKMKICIDFISTKICLKITWKIFLLAEWFYLSTRYTAIFEGIFVCWNILLSHPGPVYFFSFFLPAWRHAYNCIEQNNCNGKIHGQTLRERSSAFQK